MLRKILTILLFIIGLLWLLQIGLWLYRHFISVSPVNLTVATQTSSLGINTNEVSYIDASVPFVDLFRAASPFAENVLHLPPANITYDLNGWPTHLNGGMVGTRFLGELPADAVPDGIYTVLYEGEGELRYGNDAVLLKHERGRDTIQINAGMNKRLDASLMIAQSNPANYLRNIRILPSGGICERNPLMRVASAADCTTANDRYLSFVEHYADIIFTPEYLSFMQDFRAIRFMPMSGITRNPIVHWQDRPTLTQATWGGDYGHRGAPLEIMVELANRLHKEVWFNMPHAADDAYIQAFARYVAQHLDSKLKVYVEYSNEVWNGTFTHREYTQQQGIALGLSNNAVEAGYRYYALRSQQVFKLWQQVLPVKQRLVRVIGGWDTRPDFALSVLNYANTYQYADALAIAPYFGGNIKGFREAKTVEDIFHLTTTPDSYRSLPQVLEHVKKQATLAQQFGLVLLGYEGGQGLVDWAARRPEQLPNPLFFAANRDARMGELYRDFLHGWQQAGGELLMLFSAPRACGWYGCWGLKEYSRQPVEQAPKYQAVKQFLAEQPQWWTEQPLAKPARSPIPTPTLPANQPIITWRLTDDPETVFQLDGAQTLENLLQGKQWNKRSLYGKWQGKWDKDALFFTVQVYDNKKLTDSADPRDDDSIELFLDTANQRAATMDGKTAYHFVWRCAEQAVYLAPDSAPLSSDALAKISSRLRTTYDGYVLEAWIPWTVLGISPDIRSKVGVEVLINDDDDGGERDSRIGWNGRQNDTVNSPATWGMVLFSGR